MRRATGPPSALVVARTALGGAGRGVIATVVMSVPMLVWSRRAAGGTVPPKRITAEVTDAAGVEPDTQAGLDVASTFAHLGFGSSMGAGFSMLQRLLRPPGPTVAHGLAYGLGVWAVSYKGWVPALGIMPPAQEDRPDRQRMNILAHLVYGAVLGALHGRQGRSGHRGSA